MVKRFDCDGQAGNMVVEDDGDYVSHEDYAALLATVQKAVKYLDAKGACLTVIDCKDLRDWLIEGVRQ